MTYPLRCMPIYMEKVWGGRRLSQLMGRPLPDARPTGESWEISVHPHGESVIANGPARGQRLSAYIAEAPEAVLGSRVTARHGANFPLLIKYIDAEEALSVQVHPDDAYAQAHGEPRGKTEMWYVVRAEPDAALIVGLEPGVTADEFRAALQAGDPAALLHRMPVQAGDSIFIPAGRIHAILPGLLILEIQQNSDTTYRLYDWGRLGLDGRPRPLHVEEAMAVINWQDYAPAPDCPPVERVGANTKRVRARCPYFEVTQYDLIAPQDFAPDPGSCRTIHCVNGRGVLRWAEGEEALAFGDSVLLPAALDACELVPEETATFVVACVP